MQKGCTNLMYLCSRVWKNKLNFNTLHYEKGIVFGIFAAFCSWS